MIEFSGQLFFHVADAHYLGFLSAMERKDKQMLIEKYFVIHYSNEVSFNAVNSPFNDFFGQGEGR